MLKQEIEANKEFEAGNFKKAILLIKSTLKSNPNNFNSNFRLGLAYSYTGDEKNAIKYYLKALEMTDKEKHLVYYNLAISQSNLKRTNDAINSYTEAIKLKPDYSQAYNNRGLEYEKLNQFDFALNDIENAIALDSSDKVIFYNAARLSNKLKSKVKCLNYLENAIRLDTNYIPALKMIADKYVEIKNFAPAEPIYTRLIKLEPENSELFLKRCYVRIAIKKTNDGCLDCQKALDLKNPKAEEMIKMFCK